jgi:hypothetical protein
VTNLRPKRSRNVQKQSGKLGVQELSRHVDGQSETFILKSKKVPMVYVPENYKNIKKFLFLWGI